MHWLKEKSCSYEQGVYSTITLFLPAPYQTLIGFQYNNSELQLKKLQDADSEDKFLGKPTTKGGRLNKDIENFSTYSYSKC